MILGISAFYHDSAAAIIDDTRIIAAVQEERFSRIKHDLSFPRNSIEYCLKEAGVSVSELRAVVFYDKPLLKFERLLETYIDSAPVGFRSFVKAMPIWIKDKLFLKDTLRKSLCDIGKIKKSDLPPLLFAEHHQSHAASAFFPSPFEKAAILCMDGVGEWATTSVWVGDGNTLNKKWEIDFPHSLGLLYSAFTYYCGFKVNSGEYKVMGLAPYGQPVYANIIKEKLIDIKEDGSFQMNMDYFNYQVGLTMTNKKFDQLFGGAPRKPESELTQKEMDLAASVQLVTEEIMLKLAVSVHAETECENLCLAGGVALNCVSNGRLLRESPFSDIWVQPAAGDAGGALGAALAARHQFYNVKRSTNQPDSMYGSYLGPEFSDDEVEELLQKNNAIFRKLSSAELISSAAGLLADGNVLGWFQGRMEYGPRSLGNRSILGDSRSTEMQSELNLKIKYRESFRPFAPAVLENKSAEYFKLDSASPYMLIVAEICDHLKNDIIDTDGEVTGLERLKQVRSSIPAVTHVDYSARVQTVHKATNPKFYKLIEEFDVITGCPVLINTSFNVRGEPIVANPEDAYRCFMRTNMDYLVVGDYILDKNEQPKWVETEDWKSIHTLD